MKARVTGSKLENNQVFKLFQLEEEAVDSAMGIIPVSGARFRTDPLNNGPQ